jgi:hypothetical protein
MKKLGAQAGQAQRVDVAHRLKLHAVKREQQRQQTNNSVACHGESG